MLVYERDKEQIVPIIHVDVLPLPPVATR